MARPIESSLGVRCVVESEGREHAGCHCQERVVGPTVTCFSHVETRGWWYTSFRSARQKNRVMPAGMVLVAWSKEFDVWPARVWDPGLCYFFCNLKKKKKYHIKTQTIFRSIMESCFIVFRFIIECSSLRDFGPPR